MMVCRGSEGGHNFFGFVYRSIPETYMILSKLFKGEKAFIHSTTNYQLVFQKYFISNYGRKKPFPLVKVKEK